jgi:dienelactone hydrolase
VSAPQGDKDIASFFWLDQNRMAYLVSEQKFSGRYLFLTEAGKLASADQVSIEGEASSIGLLSTLTDDRSQMVVNLTGGSLRYDHPEIINASNHGSLVSRYPELKTDHGFNTNFWTDKTGRLEFGITEEDGILALNVLHGETWTKCPEDLDEVTAWDSGDEPGQVVVLGKRDGVGPRPLEFMNAETGATTPDDVIIQDKGYDFDGYLFRDPSSHQIVGAVYDRAAPRVVWFTETYRNLQKAIDKLFPKQVVRIYGIDDAGKVLLIGSYSDQQPVVYSWVNLETHKSGLIKNSRPWIDPKRMQQTGIIKYTTAEGRQIDAYLTLPAGATKANPPPLVVMPHEYSGNRWTWGFDPDVQFLASRGYAVLQPNYRGSSGYTWMYPESEEWDFRKMNDDIAAAAHKVIDMGLVDGHRVAIMGFNFGADLAAAGTAFEPGLYKCAVQVSGLYDWGWYLREAKYRQFSDSYYSRFRYKLGDPDKNRQKFDDMSPLPNASKIHSAMLIVWGEYDHPEVIGQAKDLASSVEKNGVPVETLSFLSEGDGVRHLGHKIELYQHIEAFLAKNL